MINQCITSYISLHPVSTAPTFAECRNKNDDIKSSGISRSPELPLIPSLSLRTRAAPRARVANVDAHAPRFRAARRRRPARLPTRCDDGTTFTTTTTTNNNNNNTTTTSTTTTSTTTTSTTTTSTTTTSTTNNNKKKKKKTMMNTTNSNTDNDNDNNELENDINNARNRCRR